MFLRDGKKSFKQNGAGVSTVPSALEKIAVGWRRLRDIFRRKTRVTPTQEHIGRQLAPYDRYVGREVHPHHTQHVSRFFLLLSP